MNHSRIEIDFHLKFNVTVEKLFRMKIYCHDLNEKSCKISAKITVFHELCLRVYLEIR